MSTVLKFRRGDTTAANAFTGAEGELFVDTTKDTLIVHDGVTQGGTVLATESFVTSQGYATSASLATVATSGSYNDLTNLPTLFSGSYTDLSNKPFIPTLVSDLTNDSNFATESFVTGQGYATSASLATVATSGSYTDLSNKPFIPTAVSDLTNDSNFATESFVDTRISNLVDGAPGALDTLNELAAALGDDANYASTITTALAGKVSLTGSYADPTWITSLAYSKLTGAPVLETVATSGSYNDLLDKPFIPTLVSDLTNDTGFITSSALTGYATETFVTSQGYATSASLATVATSGSYNDLSDKPFIPAAVSDLTNDTGFITTAALSGYATETYVGTQISNLIDGAPGALDTLNELAAALGDDANYASTITTALSDKVSLTGSYADPTWITSLAYSKLTGAPVLATVATSGSYTDLTNKPFIPTLVSDLTNDSNFATESYVTTQISNLIDGAPAALDTLNELAAALGDDANYASTITNALAAKQNNLTVTVGGSSSWDSVTSSLTIPTNVSHLTNDTGFITSSALTGYATESFVTSQGYATSASLATVATSGSYNDLINLPTLFSGSYNDLTDKPFIPTLVSDLTNDTGFITSSALTGYATETFVTSQGYATSASLATVATSGSYTDLTNKPFIPTAVSDLTNDTGFITSSALTGYATESYVSTQISNLVDGAPGALDTLNELAAALGDDANYASTITTALADKVSLTGSYADPTWITSLSYSKLTGAPVLATVATSGSYNDLINLPTLFSGSYTDLTNKPFIPTLVSDLTNDTGFITSAALTGYATETFVTSQGYATSASLATVATSGSYNDLTDKPSIPDSTSDLTNDSGFITTAALTGYATESFVTSQGYLTSYTETDPIYTASSWYSTTNNSSNWDTAYGWGNHASAGYLTAESDTLDSVTDRGATTTNSITVGGLTVTDSVQIDGNLTVSGTTVTINATNLAVEDNMIYLNDGSTTANPDLGISGNYNDGTYRHAGIFRDATDGRWKFFHQYTPEPDASVYIDTSHASFALADVQANSFIGNLTGNADTVTNGVYTTGSYADPTWITSLAYSKLTGAPSLATVATSGSYDDLTNKPFIPTAVSDLTNDTGFITSSALTGYATESYVTSQGYITSSALTGYATETFVTSQGYATSASLATVATSGSYNDLINLPTLFSGSYNDLTDKPSIPNSTSDLTNDSGFITSSALTGYATESYVATQISNLVDGAPAALDTLNELAAALGDDANYASTITTALADKVSLTGSYADPTWITSLSYSKLTGAPVLATVATSGSYTDLTNKPFIPTLVSDLTNDTGFITSAALTGYATETFVTSQGYITSAALTGYATESYVTSQGYATTASLAAVATSGSYNDLTNLPTLFSGSYTDLTNKPTLFSGSYNDLTDKPTLFSGSYTDLTDKPFIPTLVSDLTNDTGFITSSALTGYATESYVSTQISNLIDGAPGALDTLNELAAALGDDANYASTITNALAAKQDNLTVTVGGSSAWHSVTSTLTLPTNVSHLTNDTGFITSSALTGYATESYVTSQGYATSASLATVATSGSYNDLLNKPTLFSGSYTDLTNKPTLFSGSYTDLTDKPTLFSGSYTDLTDKPTLFSGSYTDLTNKPFIPTKVSDLTNDSNFATESYVTTRISNLIDGAPGALDTLNELAAALGDDANYASTISTALADKVSLTGSYANPSWITSLAYSKLTGAPTLATVATTGSYNDLINRPTIPTTTSELTNNSGFITSAALTGYATTASLATVATSGSYNDLLNKPTIPTTTSQLTNNSGFITSSALTGYATESYVTTQLSSKQATLVSGTNIKTINGSSILGSGDLVVTGTGFTNGTILADDNTALTTTSSNQEIFAYDATAYRTAKFLVQAFSGADVHSTEVLVMHNDVTAFVTEYATVYSNASLITVSASYDTATDVIKLTATPANTNTTITVAGTLIAAGTLASSSAGDMMSLSGTEDLSTGSGTEDLNA